MRQTVRLTTIVLVCLLLAAVRPENVRAQALEQRVVHIIGAGTISCGTYIKYREEANTQQLHLFVQWVWGFLSAYSVRDHLVTPWRGQSKSGSLGTLPDSDTVLLYLEKHCRERPLDNIMTATIALTLTLGGNYTLSSPK